MSFAVPLVAGALGQTVATQLAWSATAVSISGAVAAAIGAAIVSPGLPAVEGPRAADGSQMSSKYGSQVPIVYGASKIGGNIIWTSKIREVRTEEQRGGKGGIGGGGQTAITYTYYADWAISFCEGEVTNINKIWFDADLVYNSETGESTIPNFLDKVTFYYGTENQLPDPIIEALEGIDNAPPYRGICYIVFHDIELGNWGNRIPNISSELTRIGKQSLNTKPYSYTVSDSISNEIDIIDLLLRRTKYNLFSDEDEYIIPAYSVSGSLIYTHTYVSFDVDDNDYIIPAYVVSGSLIYTHTYVSFDVDDNDYIIPAYVVSGSLIYTHTYVSFDVDDNDYIIPAYVVSGSLVADP